MKYLPLSQGHFAQVDDEDYEHLKEFSWFIKEKYAVRNRTLGGRRCQEYLHHAVIEPRVGHQIIFKDSNGWNCQKSNLLQLPTSEARSLLCPRARGSSNYWGVHWNKRQQKWFAKIRINRQTFHLGTFDEEIEAALAYDKVARLYFGKEANLNFPPENKVEGKDMSFNLDGVPHCAQMDPDEIIVNEPDFLQKNEPQQISMK